MGKTLAEFTADLEKQFADLVASGDIQMPGQTSIIGTVPPVPDACKDEVKDAQATLASIAEGLEQLQVLNQWLNGQAVTLCTGLEPALAESLKQEAPMVDFTQADIEMKLEELYGMEG